MTKKRLWYQTELFDVECSSNRANDCSSFWRL